MYKEEIFGPLLPIFDFNKIEEVIEFINKNEKPLALYIFSKNNNNIKTIINNTSSGGVCINHSTLHYSNNNLPFGGINNSGTGRCHGIYGFHELSNKKSILKQVLPSSPTDFLFPPYNNFKNKLLMINFNNKSNIIWAETKICILGGGKSGIAAAKLATDLMS